MLSVREIRTPTSGELLVDPYVPFSFRADEPVRSNPLTWRYTDDDNGLLEFKIDRASGDIYGVKLVSSGQPFEDGDEVPFDMFEHEPGLPVVDARAVNGTLIEERITVRLLRWDQAVAALWGKWASSTKCLSVDRARFLLREDELVGFVSDR